eukprot:CAMPEP_0176149378 /NCGR_PEP_ID=MMETSP0120_2-20121206/76216_1 /TAXON_ID=160619 /ORGANISM="Kryptoperidinium foliaceum, Strain CCMP 1326" /LENGTH=75 /DNA_ID=CAMNT_0017486165 /DNA_START=28 /DNA_END=252 /DNA_ORIENTATION=+
MTELVLTGRGVKLDPMTFTLLSAPVCFAALGVGALCSANSATVAALYYWWPPVLLSGLLAFALNLANTFALREVS